MNKNKYKQFIFQKYELSKFRNEIRLYYSLDNKINFVEKIKLGFGIYNFKSIDLELLDKILFNLHLVVGIGYYKTYCPREIVIETGELNKEQAKFWNTLYTKGLGEFFYQNKIDFRGLVKFPYSDVKSKAVKTETKDKSLVPIGGGKDSVVSAEILKELGVNFDLFSFRDSIIQKQTSRVVGKKRVVIDRVIDKHLFELNKKGCYNGHVPISAIYSFLSLLVATMGGYRNIIFSNERSANYGNVKYLGQTINHQYSKTLEFENNFRNYVQKNITPSISYFSLLRGMSELKISQVFSRYKQYFSSFSSCNTNFSLNKKVKQKWCGECPKCAFTFSQLSAFLSKDVLIKIFGKNLYADKALLTTYQELLGIKNIKPFDCVGTPSEVVAAMQLALKKGDFENDCIMDYFKIKVAPKQKNLEDKVKNVLESYGPNNIPSEHKKNVSDIIKMKILILGYGVEGKSIYEYLKWKFSDAQFTISALESFDAPKSVQKIVGKKYLDKLNNFDLIIKSPGISIETVKIKKAISAGVDFSSTTKIFFEDCEGCIVGVTGTKGKSTTASLIYDVFKQAGKNVYLVGNIGKYNFDELKLGGGKNKIFIYELSSYQLTNQKISPHISVFINIFPDHIPYHKSYANYKKEKSNITLRQRKDDFFVYNSDYDFLNNISKETKASSIDYLKDCNIDEEYIYYKNEKVLAANEVKLLGYHNLENISAVICVAKILNISNSNIEKAVSGFEGLEHRLEYVKTVENISFYNDAISTTPESTIAAINVFEDKVGTIILGGQDRGYHFRKLAQYVYANRVDNVVLFPDSGAKIWREILKIYKNKKATLPNKLETKSMKQAVKFAFQNTASGKVCLLSNASPSYSVFKNFKEKGGLFQKEVKKL